MGVCVSCVRVCICVFCECCRLTMHVCVCVCAAQVVWWLGTLTLVLAACR